MVMIFYSGRGILTVPALFLGVVAAVILGKYIPMGPYDRSVGLLFAAFFNAAFAYWADDPAKGREVVDVKTGRKMILRRRASFFFIPMRYWTYIFVAGAILLLVGGYMHPPAKAS
jgi:hypothetical protein